MTGCTKQIQTDDKKRVQNDQTGQTLTSNILCLPKDEQLLGKYTEYKDKLEKFINDINDANAYFNEHLDEKYLKNYKFEYVLLNELKHYSPRGEVLRWMYRNMNKKKFKNNQKIRKSC